MIKAVFFDLWSTLATSSKAWKEAFKLAGYTHSKENDEKFEREINTVKFESRHALATKMCELYGGNNIKGVEEILESDIPNLYPEVPDVLLEIKKNYKIGLISNTTNIDIEKLNLNIFDTVILSADVGVIKPHKKIFEKALKSLNVNPEECIMVGDNPYADIKGAQNVGMKAILIDRNLRNPDKKSIKSLKELIPLLKHE